MVIEKKKLNHDDKATERTQDEREFAVCGCVASLFCPTHTH
jgi:hypothetical protein